MSTRVTLDLPDVLMAKVEELAHHEKHSVTDVLMKHLGKLLDSPIDADVYRNPALANDTEFQEILVQEAAYLAIKEDLLEQFEGQYVAIYQERVVDIDPDQIVLVIRIQENYDEDAVVLIRQVTRVEEPDLHIPSFRFVSE